MGNGIDTNKFRRLKNKIDIRNELGIPNDAFVICGIGRLVKGKGFQDMVEAFKLINKKSKNVYLIIVGGNVVQDISKYQSDIMHKIKEYKLQKKIKMTGMVDNVEEYLGCSDLFISASYREGISRVMLEAMCMGMPIIATRIRGSREVVKNNINGFLFTPGNVSELVEKIIYLIGSSNQKLKELSDNAYDTIHPYYTEKSYTQRQLDIIKKMEN